MTSDSVSLLCSCKSTTYESFPPQTTIGYNIYSGESCHLTFQNTSELDFGIIPYGQKKTLTRVLTNHGRVSTTYTLSTHCKHLLAKPHTGVLKSKESVVISLSFIPNQQHHQHHQQANAQPPSNSEQHLTSSTTSSTKTISSHTSTIRSSVSSVTGAGRQESIVIHGSHSKRNAEIQVYGEGGISQLHVHQSTMEFDRCMLRRPTTKEIRMTNRGMFTKVIVIE